MTLKISIVLTFLKKCKRVSKQLYVNYNCRSLLLNKCLRLSHAISYRNYPFCDNVFSHYNNFFCALQ